MMMKRKAISILLGLLLAVGVVYVSPAKAQDAQTVERLERMIKEQQKQLESMQRELNQLKQTADEAKSAAEKAKSEAGEATTAVQATIGKKDEFRNIVSSSAGNIKLSISGQVNRAVNVADDGKNTDAYFVDNDASNSRVRFIGTAKATDDLTIGSRIEVAFAPNDSSSVNQNDEDNGNLNSGDNFLDERWAEVSLASKRFGKLSLGKGDAASNNSAEVDLSKTDVVQYASIADIAGGMLFRQSSGDSLTTVKVSDAFKDLDGLSRKNRLRYDTPTFYGFSLAGSLISDQRWDTSLWWGGQGYGFKAAGAAAIANPNQDNTNYQYDGSFSLLHEASGLNLTLSAGLLDYDGRNAGTNLWGKLGWLTRFFPAGQTAFAVDYDRSTNFPTGTDQGYSVGAAAVQQFEDYGTELYVQYRLYSLDRNVEPSVQNMNVGTIGARVKF
jgi:Skp family chaperone for outer membrane proteins